MESRFALSRFGGTGTCFLSTASLTVGDAMVRWEQDCSEGKAISLSLVEKGLAHDVSVVLCEKSVGCKSHDCVGWSLSQI